MTWDLEELGDEAVTLRREDGFVLTAARGETPPSEGEPADGAVTWRFTVDDQNGERLADHGWEIVSDEHLWEVLDGFTYRFRRDAADDGHPDGAGEKQDEAAGDTRADGTDEDRDEGAVDTQGADEPESTAGTDSGSTTADPDAASTTDATAASTGSDAESGDERASAVDIEAGDEPATSDTTPSSSVVNTESAGADGDTDTAANQTQAPAQAAADGSDAPDRAVTDGAVPAARASRAPTGEVTTDRDEDAQNASAERDESRREDSGSEDDDCGEPNDIEDGTDRTDDEETTSGQGGDPLADGHEAPDDPARADPSAEAGGNEDTESTDRKDVAARGVSVRIREARPDDADRLAAVYRSAYAQNRELGFPAKAESVTPAMVGAWIDEDGVIVATVEDTVVGGVRLEATAPDRVKVSRLGVHADWKEQGVGSKLLAAAEAAVGAGNADTVWLTTPPAHPFLPDVYRERGYERTDEYPIDERDYDEIVMEKRVGD